MRSAMTKLAFWLACATIIGASLSPDEYLPRLALNWWDKAQHATAFFLLCFLGRYAYPNRQILLLLGLLGLGAAIEIAQTATGWRYGDPLDWIADAAGIALAWLWFAVMQPKTKRLI